MHLNTYPSVTQRIFKPRLVKLPTKKHPDRKKEAQRKWARQR